jgi:hypothetical protein
MPRVSNSIVPLRSTSARPGRPPCGISRSKGGVSCSPDEKILTADLDPGEIAEGKFDLDVVGHYARPDVFRLEVNEKAGF